MAFQGVANIFYTAYGSYNCDLDPGTADGGIGVEVTRQVAQRPIFLAASIFGVNGTVGHSNVSRVVVYRRRWDERFFRNGMDVPIGVNWPRVAPNALVILDTFVPAERPFVYDFAGMPDRLKVTEPGETLGAFILTPWDRVANVHIFDYVTLTFHGEDVDAAAARGVKLV